jgi:asparagine synthetase B (glutamine-hydrolysing)
VFTLPCGSEIQVYKNKKIVISKSFFSSIPTYYAYIQNGLYIQNSYQGLIEELYAEGQQLTADTHYFRAYIAFQAPQTSATIYQEIKLLRAGETCTLSLTEESVADMSSFFTVDTHRDCALSGDEFRQTLVDILSELSPRDTMFHISSGLDSSSLAILAADIFKQESESVHLASCITLGAGARDEIENVKKLADDIHADLTVYDFTDIDIFDVGHALYTQHLAYPAAHPSHLVEYLLDDAIVKAGYKTIVNGKGPDDTLAGYGWHKEAFADPKAHQNRVTVTEADLIANLLSCQGLEDKQELTFWQSCGDKLSLGERLQYDSTSLTESWNMIHASLAETMGVRIVSPFMQPSLREGMFMLPDEQKIYQDVQKVFMREVFANEYPAYIADFNKTGLRLDLKPYFSRYNQEELLNKVMVQRSVAAQYFNIKVLNDMIEQTLNGTRNFGWQLWNVFALMKTVTR